MKWNSAKTEYPQTCIHQLVEAVVDLSPDAVAVVFEQESLTYRQFEQSRQRLSAPPTGFGRRSRGVCRHLHGALPRNGSGAVGHSQGGRSLCAA
jgi:non-ribosomal peptide synthetase component F